MVAGGDEGFKTKQLALKCEAEDSTRAPVLRSCGLPVRHRLEDRRVREQDNFYAAPLAVGLVPVPPNIGARVAVAIERDAEAPRAFPRYVAKVVASARVPDGERVCVDRVVGLGNDQDLVAGVEARLLQRAFAEP